MRRPGVIIGVLVLGLLAAGAGLSANAHRSPCHTAHSCPSDHHSYVWFDAAGQGWDCAKVGAPEVTAADTQRIYYAGLAYQCHAAGGTQAAARSTLARACGPATTSFTRLHGTATLEGVAFFDFRHGQRGAAANEIELHPVLRVTPGPGSC